MLNVRQTYPRAATTAAYHYLKSHEDLGIQLKTMSIGLALVSHEISRNTSIDSLWTLHKKLGKAWGTKPSWKSPGENVERASLLMGKLGVLHSFSSFDKFLDNTQAEFYSFSHHSSTELLTSSTDSDEQVDLDARLSKLLQAHEISSSIIDFARPIQKFYQSARNCIAHRRGIASSEIENIRNSESLSNSLAAWQKTTGDYGPLQLPAVKAGEDIQFTYADSILASNALRLIVGEISNHFVEAFQLKGLVFLASRRILASNPNSPFVQRHKKLCVAVARYLSEVNRINPINGDEVFRILVDLSLHKSGQDSFDRLKS